MKKTSTPCNKLEDTAGYDTTSPLVYHKSCVSKFLTKGKCLGSQKRPSTGSSQVPEKKWDQTLGLFLYWLKNAFTVIKIVMWSRIKNILINGSSHIS